MPKKRQCDVFPMCNNSITSTLRQRPPRNQHDPTKYCHHSGNDDPLKSRHKPSYKLHDDEPVKAKGKRKLARHVIVIAGASGSGKSKLIQKLSQPPHDAFTLGVLERLDCNPKQRFKRSTVERMQRLMDPVNSKKRKARRLNSCLLLHIDLTSINHNNNLKLLRHISKQTKRLDVITLYTSPDEWRQRILDRLHTSNEPSLRAALIALSARASRRLSNFMYHREYRKWLRTFSDYKTKRHCFINTFEQSFLKTIPPN